MITLLRTFESLNVTRVFKYKTEHARVEGQGDDVLHSVEEVEEEEEQQQPQPSVDNFILNAIRRQVQRCSCCRTCSASSAASGCEATPTIQASSSSAAAFPTASNDSTAANLRAASCSSVCHDESLRGERVACRLLPRVGARME